MNMNQYIPKTNNNLLRPIRDSILEGQLINLLRKLDHQSFSDIFFGFDLKGLISGIEELLNSYEMKKNILFVCTSFHQEPNLNIGNAIGLLIEPIHQFLMELKKIEIEMENNTIVKKIEKKVNEYLNIKEEIKL